MFLMKTRTIAATTLLALLMTGAATVAFAHSGMQLPSIGLGTGQHQNQQALNHSQQNDNQTQTTSGEDDQGEQGNQTSTQHPDNDNETESDSGAGRFNLTAGTTLTFSNLTGHFVSFANLGNHSGEDDGQTTVGNSTGSFTFKVTGNSSTGFGLSIVSGTFSANGTTYTVSGGNLVLNEGDEVASGNGTASGGATFTIHVDGIHGNTTSSALVGAIRLDVKVGSSEFLVILGSAQGVEDSSQD